jgi:hypothetical protein
MHKIANCKLAHDMSQHCIPQENQLLFYVKYYDKICIHKICKYKWYEW